MASSTDATSRKLSVWCAWGGLAGLSVAAVGFVASTGSILAGLAVIIAIPVVLLGLTRPEQTALIALISSPILLSTFSVGPVTLDNVVTAFGMALAMLAAARSDKAPFAGLSGLPLLVALSVTVTSFLTGTPSIPEVIRFLGLAMVPWLATRRDVSLTFIRASLLGVTTLGALSLLLQKAIGYPALTRDTETSLLRQGGLFGHPNFAAYCLGLAIILIVLSPALKRIEISAAALFAAAIVASGARTASVVLAITLVLLLIGRLSRLLALGGLAIPILAVVGPTLFERFAALSNPAGVGNSNAVTWRINQWSLALQISADERAAGVGFHRTEQLTPNGLGAHNGYIEILVELGFLGVALVALGVALAMSASRSTRVSIGAWTFVLAASLTDPVLLYPSSLLMLLAILAMESNPRERLSDTPNRSASGPQRRGAPPLSPDLDPPRVTA